MLLVSIIDPVLGGKFYAQWPLDRSERDRLEVLAVRNCGWEKGLVADEFFLVDEFGTEVDPAFSGEQPPICRAKMKPRPPFGNSYMTAKWSYTFPNSGSTRCCAARRRNDDDASALSSSNQSTA